MDHISHSTSAATAGELLLLPLSTSSQRHGKRPHPTYRGIRARGSKWVSEIRLPRSSTRVWLGSFPTAEMAAAAFDTASLALRGHGVALNFPDAACWYPQPESMSAEDIRAAASAAAVAFAVVPPPAAGRAASSPLQQMNEMMMTTLHHELNHDYTDEDSFFDMPNMMFELAEGLMVSPPRMMPSFYDPMEGWGSSNDGLWGYP